MSKMTVAYIAHPVRGDLGGAIKSLIKINREINLMEPDVIPFIPYFVDIQSLSDDITPERNRGIKNDVAFLKMGFVDEIRLYGPHISEGMKAEIELAWILEIKVRPMGIVQKSNYNKFKLEMRVL